MHDARGVKFFAKPYAKNLTPRSSLTQCLWPTYMRVAACPPWAFGSAVSIS